MIINLNINHNYIKIILKFVSAYLKDIFQKRKEILLCFVSISALTIAIIVLILGFTLFSATQKTILNSLQGIQPDLTLQIPQQEDIDLIELQKYLCKMLNNSYIFINYYDKYYKNIIYQSDNNNIFGIIKKTRNIFYIWKIKS